MGVGRDTQIEELGILTPRAVPVAELGAGEVGYLFAGFKDIHQVKVGDTLTDAVDPAGEALPGFREAKPMVFAGLYPVDSAQFGELRDALEKLSLNDSAFTFQADTSQALGFGFRCGFLGLLHMEIAQERLEREFGLQLITTAPERRLPGAHRQRRGRRGAEPLADARPGPDRGGRGADHPGHDPDPRGARRRHSQAPPGTARRAGQVRAPRRRPDAPRVPLAARRGGARLLRPAQVGVARLRLVRLPRRRLPRGRPRQARPAGQRRAGRRPGGDRAPRGAPTSGRGR